MAIKVVLADDHALVRAGLASLVASLDNIAVVGEAANGYEALSLVEQLEPDLVLMDIEMPRLNGLESTARILKTHPNARVIIVSMYNNEEFILRALRAGASGYLLKDAGPQELERALRSVMLGEIHLDSRLSVSLDDYLYKIADLKDPLEKLTPRQREVLQLLTQGQTSKEIAKTLHVSVKTIESHRSQLMSALDIHDIAGLVRFAIRTKLVSADK